MLDMEHLSPSKFADLIGVQRSSISHVLSGRNNPSYDFLQKTLKSFPGLKADWLLLGEGSMYEHMGRDASANLFPTEQDDGIQNPPQEPESTKVEPVAEMNLGFEGDTGEEEQPGEQVKEKKIVQVMILFDDDTFTLFRPSL